MKNPLQTILQELKDSSNFRTLFAQKHQDLEIQKNGKWLFNLASNDYLNLANNQEFIHEFLDSELFKKNCFFSSSSSRSLSGNFEIYEAFESHLESLYHKKALLFNSGYHVNVGILNALSRLKNVLFLADRSIHASHIDGLKSFSKISLKRFLHNDMQDLEKILEKNANNFELIFILSEGLFSMEGDFAKIESLIALKNRFENVYLYIDEAHSIGSFGENGLGICYPYLKDIDFIILTFGKALASMGACVLCNQDFKDYFINFARSLIYSTALPPVNIAMSYFAFLHLPKLHQERKNLAKLSFDFKSSLQEATNYEIMGDYNILSLVLKENQKAVFFQKELEKRGFFAPAIKPPTIPNNRACLRFSLTQKMPFSKLQSLHHILKEIDNEYISRT